MSIIRKAIILICVFLIGGCSSSFSEWKEAKGQDTLSGYEGFLKENPKSAFTELAMERMKELRWDAAQRTNTPEALQGFAASYPDDELAQKALDRMQVVEWQQAKDLNTPEGYRNFAIRYPHGARAVEAEKKFRLLASDQLNIASGKGNLQEVKRLLAMDLDVNNKTNNGTTPLMWASLKGHAGIVDALLHHGALVNDRTDEGVTALMLAAQDGFQEIVDVLLQNGADPNNQNIRSETAMDLASKMGHVNVLNALLDVAIPLGKDSSSLIKPPSTKILVSGIEQVVRKSAPELQADQELDIDILAVSHFDSIKNHILVYSRIALRHEGQWVPLYSIKHFKATPLPNSAWKLEMVTDSSSKTPIKTQEGL